MLHGLEHAGYAYELTLWPSGSGRRPLEVLATRRLFAALTRDPRRTRELRAWLAAQSSGRLVSRMTDAQIVGQLVARVAARRLYVYAEPVRRPSFAFEVSEPPEEVLGPLPVQETLEPAVERIDTPGQVAALLHAALEGLPFCEECEKAQLDEAVAAEPYADVDVPAQAAVMREAAAAGVPFCAECAKAKAAPDAGASPTGA
jgi:hypothetical protein